MEPSTSNPLPLSFSELGTIHVHVDGGGSDRLVRNIVDTLNREGFPSKLTPIIKAVPGPQREDIWATYRSHTPGTGEQEQLDYFSTTCLAPSGESKAKLGQVLESLSEELGIVIEAEQVVGKGGRDIVWSDDEPFMIYSTDVGFKRAPTLPIEIHYSCDIPKEAPWQSTLPIEPAALRDVCLDLGIRIGGWFLFDDGGNTWAYRSNMFAEGEAKDQAFRERVRKQRDDLERELFRLGDRLGFRCSVNVLVERSLGVWKTPLSKLEHFKDIKQLARWEENFPHLQRFWVIAPNFLGDIDDDFRRAMIRNFRRGVEYTYFLNSFAGVQRLRQFAKSLSEVDNLPFVFESIKVVLLGKDVSPGDSPATLLNGEYFIANPSLGGIHTSVSSNTQGYRLRRSKERVFIGGMAMSSAEIEGVVNRLQPILDSPIHGLQLSLEPDEAENPVNRAVIYTDLRGSTKMQEKLGDDAWSQVLLAYDFIVANETSKLSGEVVKNLGDGYLLIFDQAGAALRCAERLQLAVQEYNSKAAPTESVIPPQKIALDFGPVSKVMRAHGFDFTGKTLSRCARLIEEAAGGQVLMLDTIREMARASAHNWINERTAFLRTIEFKGLEGTYELWEFRWEEV